MFDKNKPPYPPAYNDLAQLLFLLQMSNMSNLDNIEVDSTKLIDEIDRVISIIHANRILENSIKI